MSLVDWFNKTPGKTLVLALLAGALVTFSLAPFNIWPAGIVSLILLIACLQQATPKQAFIIGWAYGFGLFGTGVSWVYVSIHEFGLASVPLAGSLTLLFIVGLAVLFSATFGYVYARFFSYKPFGVLPAFPALWVLFEWLRSWLLTGFPWLYLGYAHTDTWLANLAPITGVYGLSLISSLTAAAIYLLLKEIHNRTFKKVWLYTALILLPWVAGYALKNFSWVHVNDAALNVTLIQPNISQSIKWQPEQRNETLRLMYEETKKHLDSDLIIWPENGIPLFHHQATGYLQAIEAMAAVSETTILSGIPYWEENDSNPEGVIHNSIVVTGQTPEESLYHKQKLVPFGEYVPLEDQLRGLITFFDLPMSNFRPGSASQTALNLSIKGETVRVAPYICYEIVYPDFVRELGADADFFLTISDDSWFGHSIGPKQHMQMARMRALENGRYLIRGTNTGITAIVNHHGKITTEASSFEQTSLTGQIKTTSGQTPFMRWGSLWILLTCAALLGITLISGRKKISDDN